MRAINVNGALLESNPLIGVVDIADACAVETENIGEAVKALVIDLMGDQHSLRRNPDAVAVLYGEMLSIVPLLTAFSHADADRQALTVGALDFIWAYACNAYAHACDLLGDDPDRHHPLAFAHVMAAYYRAMVERMRLETSGQYKVLH